MPTYDYECTKCGHAFDAFQSMSDDPLLKCPSCNKNGLKRLIGGGLGLIFKGSGFYVTDSRSGSSKSDGESTPSKSSSGDSSSSDSTSKSSKPDAAKSSSSSDSKANKGSKAAS